jgi:GLPGLI family protein
MKRIVFLLFIIISQFSLAQKTVKTNSYKISYSKSSNGNLIENQDAIVVFTNEDQTILTLNSIVNGSTTFPFEQTIINRTTNYYTQIAQLDKTKTASTIDSISIAKQNFEISNDFKTVLGYKCQKAKTIINSNTIELWFTNDLKLKGAPTILGQNLGLVLEMVRNGNFLIAATKVEKTTAFPNLRSLEKTVTVDALSYKDLLWKSRFITLPIFKEQLINFSDEAKSNDSILRFANGTIAVRKIKFPTIPVGSQVFIDVNEQSNGDAYDRTGSAFIIPTDNTISFMDGLQNGIKTLPIYTNGNGKNYQGVVRTENYSPLLEVLRFFTPFGVKQYNTLQLKDKVWQESAPYRQDISDLRSVLSNKEVWIGINIGNYDKGGHKVSANITIHNEEEIKATAMQVLPLFNTNNVMEMAGQEYATMFDSEKGLEINFTLTVAMKNARLRYITTGHGGWENGDEFVPKKNTLILNQKEIFSFTPWRQDCGSYRLYNPASGNFPNGLSSSDYSRSNWCPGTVTNPIYIDLGNLAIGNHTLQIKIPQGTTEGTSFNSWNVSGVLIGE